jgi:hypothetical protein
MEAARTGSGKRKQRPGRRTPPIPAGGDLH